MSEMLSVIVSVPSLSLKEIINGVKTVDIRRTKPKTNEPFKVYLYCTKGSGTLWILDKETRKNFPDKIADVFTAESCGSALKGNGKIIGEFICDKVYVGKCGKYCDIPLNKAQIDAYDLLMFANGKTVYGWNISNLLIYDKPRELSEFTVPVSYKNSTQKKQMIFKQGLKPPQSWVYAEEM